MRKILAGAIPFIAALGFAHAAHAYTLTPTEARFISVSETDNLFHWTFATQYEPDPPLTSNYYEDQFIRDADNQVEINSHRIGDNVFYEPDEGYHITIYEYPTYYYLSRGASCFPYDGAYDCSPVSGNVIRNK